MAKQLAPKEKEAPSHVDLMRVTASDISPTAVDMSLLNFTLWGIPAQVYHQNALSMETWGHWKNIHWHRVGEDQRQDMLQEVAMIKQTFSVLEQPLDPAPQEKAPEYDIKIPKREGNGGQWEMEF